MASGALNGGTDLERQKAWSAFQRAYPSFESTARLDELRTSEYARLDRQQQVYLDYTGGGLYAESQLRAHKELLENRVLGNPHSANLTSLAMTRLVEEARRYVLEFFNASPDEYAVIFTPNATGALKLVGEAYPFEPGDRYLLTYDNHNSVNGIREFARARGAAITYTPVRPPDLRLDEARLETNLAQARPGGHNLFAFPAQSNFSGVQHSLEWIGRARARGWDVLVDCAAFVPTNKLDLDRWHPDFVPLSFYKMFGYPTGVGCLIARREALAHLRRPWYAGGTLRFSSVVGDGHYFAPGVAAFEDGTVNYLSIPAVEFGLHYLAGIGQELIHTRVICLTGWLLDQLVALRHSNGMPLVRLYGPLTTDSRGATIALNFTDPAGNLFDCRESEREANRVNISLRAGCHCNPGAREVAFGFTREEMAHCFIDRDRMTHNQFEVVIDCDMTGAARVSLGLATNFEDLFRFLLFAKSFIDRPLVAEASQAAAGQVLSG